MVFIAMVSFALLVTGAMLHGQPAAGANQKVELDVPYEPTSYGIASEMLTIANVTSKDLLYDLGCGDGRIVIMAAKERGTKGIGVDVDPERIRESRENAERAGVSHLVSFYEQNLFQTKISDATVMMLYLWPEVNLKLRPKLLKELKPGTRIVSHSHTMGEWADDATREVEGHTLHFFVVPANASGRWQWTGPDKETWSLELTQKFQKIKGSIRVGKQTFPIFNSSLRGNELIFSVERKRQEAQDVLSFSGRISDDSIHGEIAEGGKGYSPIRWNGARVPSTMVPIAQ